MLVIMPDIRAFWRRQVLRGTRSSMDYPARRRVILVNQGALLGILISLFYTLAAATYSPRVLWPLILFIPLEMAGFALVLWLNKRYWHTAARAASIFLPAALIVMAAWMLGNGVGAQLYFFVLWTVAFLLYSREERWLFLLAASIWIGSYIWIQLSFGTPYLTLPEAERFSAIVFTLNAIGSFALLGAVLSLFYGEIRRTETELQRQYRLSEDLLANILPARIAEQLKDGPETVAQGFSNVTLLFADIVGFTRLAEKLSPREVVDLLNQIFSRFDLLTERLGLEKIKTIGDEYMLAGGLPEPRRGHAAAVADAALQMMEAIETINRKTGRNLDLRIGIHSGEVVAGVIGSRKFSYDVWGDTVNTASRMQSQSVPGRIQVSQAAYERLKHAFEFKPRGSLRVRGKGRMKTWYLEARKVELDEPAVSE